jgi:peptidoglycan-associated lipoprotein
MQIQNLGVFAATALASCALGLGGCATKEYVNMTVEMHRAELDSHIAQVESRVQSTQTQVDRHQEQIGQLDRSTKEALDRAIAAGKLAEGKFLYSVALSDDSVKFPLDSSRLSPEAQQRLMTLVDRLKSDNRNVYVEIQGHTDSTGPDSFNKRLGEQRAEAVRLFMNQHGVPLNRMSTISFGEQEPAADNNTRAGRAQNRRVVLIVMS